MILEKTDIKSSSRKIKAASCLPCTEGNELKFTLMNLSIVSDVPFENFKNYECIGNFFWAFSELKSPVSESEKKEIEVGLIDRYKCMICEQLIGATEKMADHVNQQHSEEETFECTSGCGSYFRQRDMESHKAECGILCPAKYCKKKFAVNTGHFLHVHPCVTCTFHGCTTAFELTKGGQGGINDYLMHIMTAHCAINCNTREASESNGY
ncbi:Hypothetical predicted protein [Cloeon dipterum]|uniref:C2H2-type domain-containing protein n=1 Tax=Cloeon dipterum TaxID=197152 RepID=A0A8S1DJ69_9INSE|nr:Hypothetical predicted protein [Cloeon dipterum]